MNKKILIVEDNTDIANMIIINLRNKQMKVDHVTNGNKGLEKALHGDYDLVILDLMLPGLDGMDLCRAVREARCFTPILMLTARTSELDRVLGLELGADDYLTKPFSIHELLARVNALIRRNDQYRATKGNLAEESDSGSIRFGQLYLDPASRAVSVSDRSIILTSKEFDLLWHFASHPGRVYTRDELLDAVWGYSHSGYEHTVNSHINRLRAKIEQDPAKPDYVLTVWGVGYKFTENRKAC